MKGDENEVVPFFELPLYHAMIDKILIFGAPIKAIVLNVGIAVIFIMYFHFFWILIVTAILHYAITRLSKNDAQFFDCLFVYQQKKKYYST
ncbi:VirB3 family type IV secretion system protein [Anaerovibrio sp.]|uniref:VirB3 family type IV secretion system protein n=1 Tax=Anaerovibrio sp. TaxID=1872532 RepID=UPI0038909E84